MAKRQFSECTTPLDFVITYHGSVIAFLPLTEAAQTFLEDRVAAEAWQYLGKALVVDARPASDLIVGLLNEGLNFHYR